MSNDSYDELERLVMADPIARTAAAENDLRRSIAAAFDDARTKNEMSLRDLAKAMDTSLSQVQRLLHRELGGSLTLRTLVRAADVLKQCVTVSVRPEQSEPGKLLVFGSKGWTQTNLPHDWLGTPSQESPGGVAMATTPWKRTPSTPDRKAV